MSTSQHGTYTPMALIDAMIAAGYGDVEQPFIRPDWQQKRERDLARWRAFKALYTARRKAKENNA